MPTPIECIKCAAADSGESDPLAGPVSLEDTSDA